MAKRKKKLYSSYWMPEEDSYVDPFEDLDIEEDDNVDDKTPTINNVDPEKAMRLAALRRAIGNFVSIISKREIPVQFADADYMKRRGVHGFTDNEKVVISAETNPNKFDFTVGVALHEGAHVLLSDFKFRQEVIVPVVQDLENGYLRYCNEMEPTVSETFASEQVVDSLFHPEIRAYAYEMTVNEGTYAYARKLFEMFEHVDLLYNYLEDFRIDKYAYMNAQGYRPYYDALYDDLHNASTVTKNLIHNPEWKIPTIDNYTFRIRAMINPSADPHALPGLAEMIERVGLDNIERLAPENDRKIDGVPAWKKVLAYEHTPNMWQLVNEIFVEILRNVSEHEKSKCEKPSETEDESDNPKGNTEDINGEATPRDSEEQSDDSSDADGGDDGGAKATPKQNTKSERKKYNETSGERARRKIEQFARGKMKKKKVSQKMAMAVDAMETANASMVTVADSELGVPRTNCMVIRKVTEQLLNQDWFLFRGIQYYNEYRFKNNNWRGLTEPETDHVMDKAIAAGRRMGAILVDRLQVRNDPQLTTYTRLPHGSIDRRMLAQLGMDLTNVFKRTRTDQHTPAMLHLSLDASSSMGERGREKWLSVVTVATALAYVGSNLRNVETVITIRGGEREPVVGVVFDSRRDRFAAFRKLIRVLGPYGFTPEGLAFKATMDLVLESAKTHDVYFINFSDGMPYFPFDYQHRNVYGDEVSFKHTRKMVNELRENGVKVLSYFISHCDPKTILAYNEEERQNFGWDVHEAATSYGNFRKMYGDDAVNVDVKSATQVIGTLNRRLATR